MKHEKQQKSHTNLIWQTWTLATASQSGDSVCEQQY